MSRLQNSRRLLETLSRTRFTTLFLVLIISEDSIYFSEKIIIMILKIKKLFDKGPENFIFNILGKVLKEVVPIKNLS